MRPWKIIFATALVVVLAGCAGEKKDSAPAGQPQTQTPPAQTQAAPAQTQTAPPATTPAETKPAEPKPAETKPAEPKTPPPKPKETESQPTTRLVTLAPGYEFQVVLDQTLSTEHAAAGQSFQAKLAKPAVLKTVGTVIPEGSSIRGEVVLAKRAARVGGKAEMTLDFRELTTPDGKTYPLHAKELALQGEGTGSGDIQKVVGGAVGGAILGGILGGKGGAVKGGAAGAAGGAAWAVATRGNDIVIDPGQVIQVTLERELHVPVTTPAGNAIP
jgi:hypothetical protein